MFQCKYSLLITRRKDYVAVKADDWATEYIKYKKIKKIRWRLTTKGEAGRGGCQASDISNSLHLQWELLAGKLRPNEYKKNQKGILRFFIYGWVKKLGREIGGFCILSWRTSITRCQRDCLRLWQEKQNWRKSIGPWKLYRQYYFIYIYCIKYIWVCNCICMLIKPQL